MSFLASCPAIPSGHYHFLCLSIYEINWNGIHTQKGTETGIRSLGPQPSGHVSHRRQGSGPVKQNMSNMV
eukprot:scaffold471600_cov17-Prasinocladus_malaysianus.AAC.1